MNFYTGMMLILISLILSCSHKSDVARVDQEVVNVAVILPYSGKWEYREYKNGEEVRYTVFNFYLLDKDRKQKGNIYSNVVRDRVETALYCRDPMANLFRKGKITVNVVDRKRVDRVFEEYKFQSSGFVDKDTVVEIGKLAGAQLIVFVEPRYISFKRDYYIDENKVGIPLLREKGKLKCVSFRASVRINIALVDVKTARVILSKLYEGQSEPKRQCSKHGYRTDMLPPHDDIIDEAIKVAIKDFSSDFCRIF